MPAKAVWIIGAALALCCGAVDARADLKISSNPTKNVTCSGGVCMATAKNAVLNVSDLAGMLASGDVTVQSGSIAQDIEINAALSWASVSRLTLDSFHAIAFDRPVSVAGTGALTITTNDGGTGGDFSFAGKGHVEFWDRHSSLVINGNAYKLFHSIAELPRKNTEGFFALSRDYNAAKDGTYTRIPVPSLDGVIEGLGNTISNFSLSFTRRQPHDVAFCAENQGTIRDLALENANVMNAIGAVATLVARNFGTIHNASASGQVTTGNNTGETQSIGGLVGFSQGPISGSHSSVAVTAYGAVNTGGLVGVTNAFAPITDSFATGDVTGSDGATGGLVGSDGGDTISQSYATGSVTGNGPVGGFVGGDAGVITNAYATGSVTGPSAGGFLGESAGNPITISNAYSIGAVSGTSQQGGFAGEDIPEAIASSYWDLDTSGISDPADGAGNPPNDPGITGLSDSQLKSGLPSGFDPAIWGQSPAINNGYPYLLANPPAN